MGVYVLSDLLYRSVEVYIDDLLIFGSSDPEFLANARQVFQRCREKNVTLKASKVRIGFDMVQFVGHEIDAQGINMSQKRIEGTVNFTKPTSVKEMQAFLGLVNYFRDHLRDHSVIAQPLYQMVTASTQVLTKQLTWSEKGEVAFETLKSLVNRWCECCAMKR
jgi:hypothetical protein